MPPVNFDKLKLAPGAQEHVNRALSRASGADLAKVKELLAAAAKQNGDGYLTAAEARAVADAFEQASGGAAGALTGAVLGAALDHAAVVVKSMETLSNVDGVSAHFTTQESLEAKLIFELQDAVGRAAGRPMEVNMMIFEFQSDEVERAIVDLAQHNPNVTFRIVADSGQASSSGGNALPSILSKRLPNVQVKFKKDFPYVWSAAKGMPVYNHGATAGLNHHKGFATFIDGMPDRLATGSFNWSDTADEKNYEDLVVMRSSDAATRRAVLQYADEFAGFFNNEEASLSPNAFYNFKRTKWNEMVAANGGRPSAFTAKPPDPTPAYSVPVDTKGFDLNGFRSEDRSRLEVQMGRTLASSIYSERARHGRFASLSELSERVPGVAALSPDKRAALEAAASFGSHAVSINDATLEELDNAGFSKEMAKAIVDYRERNGDFESLEELLKVPLMTANRMAFAKKYLTAVDVEAFFNSRPYGATAAGTGYGSGGSRTTAVMAGGGVVSPAPASVTAGAADLFARAKPGESIGLAMYGISPTSPEFRSLVAAARRGVSVRVVVNDDYTETAVNAMKALKAQGVPIDVRVQSAKTMHEKFGVVGDDVFFGSANFSESSSTKHSEDRFVVKNSAEMSAAFRSQFELLWARSRVV
ncbi:MAG: helix-hairpin-helix domain-containing protein [Myxococcales bacterium]|nr:helix-hairpin-helix domain-containing protein [Myxococcales bacterium]